MAQRVETANRCECGHANWQHAREGDPRLEQEDFEVGECYVSYCDCKEYKHEHAHRN